VEDSIKKVITNKILIALIDVGFFIAIIMKIIKMMLEMCVHLKKLINNALEIQNAMEGIIHLKFIKNGTG
jgi:hypothetical protein